MAFKNSALLAAASLLTAAALVPLSTSVAAADTQPAAAPGVESLSSALGASFGGAWLDAGDGDLVVGVTDRDEFDEVTRTGAEPRLVRHSAAELDTMVDKLDAVERTAPKSITRWGVDVRHNAVNMTVLPGSAEQARDLAASVGITDVRIQESAEVPRLYADIQGGEAYHPGNSRCSVGFSVRGGFVTAGHCETETGGGSLTKDGRPLGQWGGSRFPGADYAWVRTNSNWTPVGSVTGVGRVAGSREAATGAGVTKSGSTTGVTRGTIGQKNQTVRYPQGAVRGLTATNALCRPGDSGGAFISNGQAQGVVSGGDSRTCFFQPVRPILSAYNLTLVTG
ncbi:S1 family peptidase [Amycolatopsis aidingensis]|uniref:S1 family peptidase n=1 Tax=Amycolatopsis aidingensis TaxID=2842453 RepID=UPI001E597741|nr:S1 family peptidase [Amycolatopsis aidingensis]